MDLSGSGFETAAHVLQTGRLTVMFVNLVEGPPRIVRLFSRRVSLRLPDECSVELLAHFPESLTLDPGFRCVYELEVRA